MKFKAKFDRLSFTANEAIISFVTADKWTAGQVAERMSKTAQGEDMPLTVEVRPYKSKRSVEQNRTMWEMLTILSKAVHKKADSELIWETYCEMLLKYGQEPFYLQGLPETKDELQKYFRALRVIEKREVNGKELYMYQCFHGSSKFNTKQMYEFMNSINEELAGLGIHYEIGENNKHLKE